VSVGRSSSDADEAMRANPRSCTSPGEKVASSATTHMKPSACKPIAD
jgi:hypothetical protein